MLIAVDHGNKQIKTVHTPPFTSGLIQSDTPGFGTDALAYSAAPADRSVRKNRAGDFCGRHQCQCQGV